MDLTLLTVPQLNLLREALQCQVAKDNTSAMFHYRLFLRQVPDHPLALVKVGVLLAERGQLDEALEWAQRAMDVDPHEALVHLHKGTVHEIREEWALALAAYRQAIELNPGISEAYSALGGIYHQQGLLEEALEVCERACALDPQIALNQNNLGLVLVELGRDQEALTYLHRALELDPRLAAAHNNKANALMHLGRMAEALEANAQAMLLDPMDPNMYVSRGVMLHENRMIEGVEASYLKAIELRPHFVLAHYNLGYHYLRLGDFKRGFEKYEWRWQWPQFVRKNVLPLGGQIWDGRPFPGQTLVIHAEQGIGDTFQFLRFIPLAAARGGRVLFYGSKVFSKLLQSQSGAEACIYWEDPLPAFDWRIPLLSLPRVLGTRLEDLPISAPYLEPVPHAPQAQAIEDRLQGAGRPYKLGLVFAGNSIHPRDAQRSIFPARLKSLAGHPQIRWVGLQKWDPPQAPPQWPKELEILDLGDLLTDWADTAHALSCLDLLVTVDTATAHLAGAMGIPTLLLLDYASDWRWMLETSSSPWYPSFQLYRQSAPGDWESVFQAVLKDIAP